MYSCLSVDVKVDMVILTYSYYTEKPCEGSYFGFRDDDGCHYRVRVLKFSQPLGLYFYHKEQARVGYKSFTAQCNCLYR